MLKQTASTKGAAFENTRNTIRGSPIQFRNGVKISVRRERGRLNKEFQRKIPLPAHPFVWSTNAEAQRRAQRWWFMAVRKGLVPTSNGRYARTGLLQKSWKLESRIENYFGGITITNTRKGAEHVVGLRQVPSHASSGYPRIDKLAEKSSERMTNEVIALWGVVSVPAARAQ